MTQTLTYNQPVRLAAWSDTAFATVFTTRGYAAQNGLDADQMEARAREHGHDLVGTIQVGGALIGDRAESARRLAEARATVARAVTLTDGETVEIEGALYRVRVMPGNGGRFPTNSDPIKFIPEAQ